MTTGAAGERIPRLSSEIRTTVNHPENDCLPHRRSGALRWLTVTPTGRDYPMAQTDEPPEAEAAQSDTGPGSAGDIAGNPGSSHAAACTVVGIGASAGGFEAFGELLNALPNDTGMAFVPVQHLDPRHTSALAGLLGHRTKLPVVEVSQGTVVLPNRIYVIPPNANMAIARGALSLTPRPEAGGRYMPIDSFLCSLAEDQKGKAIGVILSGAATDGTLGLKALK